MLMDELLDWASEEDDAFILVDYYDHPVSLQSLFFLSLQSIKTNSDLIQKKLLKISLRQIN
jgi:hypothetical protein